MKMMVLKNKAVIFLFLLALLSGFFWNHKMLGQPISGGGDESSYNIVAVKIYNYFHPGMSVGFTALPSDGNENLLEALDPFYPVFLAGIYFVFGVENFDAVRVVQIFLFAFTVLLIYLLAKDLFDKKTTFLSALLLVLFFPLANAAGHLTRESLFTFLLVLLVFLLYKAQKTLKLEWFILSGLVLGLAVLTNMVLQFFVIFILFGLIFVFRKDFFQKRVWIKVGIFISLFLMIVGSWFLLSRTADNYDNLKSGLILSRKAEAMEAVRGEKYLDHLVGQFFGYYFIERYGIDSSEMMGHPQLTKTIQELSEDGYTTKEIGTILKEKSLRIIFRDIPHFFAISILDFLQFNGPMLPIPENLQAAPAQNLFTGGSHPEIPNWGKVVILLILRILYWLFFGLVIYGCVKAVKEWKKFGWIILIILYFNLVYSALFGIPRYSIPVYPFYITLFVYGMFNVFKKCNYAKQK